MFKHLYLFQNSLADLLSPLRICIVHQIISLQFSIPALKCKDGTFVTDNREKAKICNNFFVSAFTTDNGHFLIDLKLMISLPLPPSNSLWQIVAEALSKSSLKFSGTPDGL